MMLEEVAAEPDSTAVVIPTVMPVFVMAVEAPGPYVDVAVESRVHDLGVLRPLKLQVVVAVIVAAAMKRHRLLAVVIFAVGQGDLTGIADVHRLRRPRRHIVEVIMALVECDRFAVKALLEESCLATVVVLVTCVDMFDEFTIRVEVASTVVLSLFEGRHLFTVVVMCAIVIVKIETAMLPT